ncbi:MAG: aminomethyl-transferring glycine dehydrogenase subunit GcvPA [candidate division KSB1 bacterium]|nr:aminomethyl-transferring glycine dehydrogenase subunit GcvPA [candidate division KSB1 bacterium]
MKRTFTHLLPSTEEQRAEMLKAIGVKDFVELLAPIPEHLRLKGPLSLPEPLSEYEVTRLLRDLAEQNTTTGQATCFLGGGAYDHFVPAAVGHITSRPEFYTAYTPYQPEVSQGTLQAIYEYQSMVCMLTGMDASNASMYDGASALAEAALLAFNHTQRREILVSRAVNPFYIEAIRTYCHGQGIEVHFVDLEDGATEVDNLRGLISEKTAGVIVQHPNFYGCLEDVAELATVTHQAGALFITSNDPISLGLLQPPGAYGADIATGEGQPLGVPLSYGGPYLGIFAARQELVRRMPGRIAGQTVDTEGRTGYVLTYQTREQHIRREKATSNICTNQALVALAATVYLALMGKHGLRAVANLCVQKSHYLAAEIAKVPGFRLKFGRPFFKEFVVETPVPADEIVETLSKKGILAGLALGRYEAALSNCLLIAVTEKRTKKEMDGLVAALRECTRAKA